MTYQFEPNKGLVARVEFQKKPFWKTENEWHNPRKVHGKRDKDMKSIKLEFLSEDLQ